MGQRANASLQMRADAFELLLAVVQRDVRERIVQRIEQQRRPARRAGAILDDRSLGTDPTRDFPAVALEQEHLGTRQVILGLLAQLFEQRATLRIAGKDRGQLFLVLAQPLQGQRNERTHRMRWRNGCTTRQGRRGVSGGFHCWILGAPREQAARAQALCFDVQWSRALLAAQPSDSFSASVGSGTYLQ
jgi:hypothetical protein